MDKERKSSDYYFTDEDYLDMTNACSSNDCTGLIPGGDPGKDSTKPYNDLYQFTIPRDDAKLTDKYPKNPNQQ